jgi:subtilisin family serine protease
VNFYKSNEHVSFAEPNYITSLPTPVTKTEGNVQSQNKTSGGMTIPNDPDFGLQWGLYNTSISGSDRADIHAPEAWNITTGSSDVIVAVIDTGVDYTHEDLADNCINGYDFVNMDDDPMDDHGHGTHCAGIISAVTDNNIGIAGISWNSKILPIKSFSSAGYSSTSQEIMGINYAKERGANIISCSWGGPTYSAALKEAIESTPALFVCAAGNDAVNCDSTPEYPASYDSANIISVGASDANDAMTWFSNYGSTTIDLMAPGEGIYSTIPGGYEYMDGTSMATPFVSGTAALVKSLKSAYEPVQIKNLIMNTVDQKSGLSGVCVTGGRLNAYNTLYKNLPLEAAFTATPTNGTIPLNVKFTDTSFGTPDAWHWSFGDGFESTAQNPTHMYMLPGKYTVTLTVYNGELSSIAEKTNLIQVKPPYQPVKQFPDGKGGYYPFPTDPDGDGLYEDINGNGWLEYGDPKLFFDQMIFAMKGEPVGQFDFDGNGFIGFGDVVALYQMV